MFLGIREHPRNGQAVVSSSHVLRKLAPHEHITQTFSWLAKPVTKHPVISASQVELAILLLVCFLSIKLNFRITEDHVCLVHHHLPIVLTLEY